MLKNRVASLGSGIFHRLLTRQSPCPSLRSVETMRKISNLRKAEPVLLFELQDIRYVATHRLKVCCDASLSMRIELIMASFKVS